jgi:integrase
MDWLAELRRHGKPRPELAPDKQEWTRKELARLLGVKPASIPPVVRRQRLHAEGKGKARRYPRATVEALLIGVCQGASVATTNQYLGHLKAFCNWLVKDGRTDANPVAHLDPGNADLDRRHDRRELDADELRRVLAAARDSGRTFRGLTGRDRFHLYATGCGTGFRAAALASLTPESFDLAGDTATVTLAARKNKSRKLKVQPLPPDVADLLREYLTGRAAGQPVWPGTWAALRVGADMLRIDLDAAGIPYTVEGPDGPLFADFHSLRHSYLTLGGRAGIDLRTLQELAGHSTPTLTARYSHRRLYDLAGAVEKMPSLLPAEGSTEAGKAVRRATGTDGTASESGDKAAPRHAGAYTPLTQVPDRDRGTLRVADGTGEEEEENATSLNPLHLQGVEACRERLMTAEERAGDRIRTDDVQLGKRSTLSVRKPTEVLQGKSLRLMILVCKVVRRRASTCENTRYFGVNAGRIPVVPSLRQRAISVDPVSPGAVSSMPRLPPFCRGLWAQLIGSSDSDITIGFQGPLVDLLPDPAQQDHP